MAHYTNPTSYSTPPASIKTKIPLQKKSWPHIVMGFYMCLNEPTALRIPLIVSVFAETSIAREPI
jgi:hypothetical protein